MPNRSSTAPSSLLEVIQLVRAHQRGGYDPRLRIWAWIFSSSSLRLDAAPLPAEHHFPVPLCVVIGTITLPVTSPPG